MNSPFSESVCYFWWLSGLYSHRKWGSDRLWMIRSLQSVKAEGLVSRWPLISLTTPKGRAMSSLCQRLQGSEKRTPKCSRGTQGPSRSCWASTRCAGKVWWTTLLWSFSFLQMTLRLWFDLFTRSSHSSLAKFCDCPWRQRHPHCPHQDLFY